MRRVGRSCPVKDKIASVPILLPLTSQNDVAIENLLDAAFGPDRHGRTAYKIRQGMGWLPRFSYAASDDDGRFIGLLQSWPVALIGRDPASDMPVETPLIMVGPVAVAPHYQGGGIGRMMMDRLMEDADNAADAPLMMIGDPEYYDRFWGFTAQATARWSAPGPVEAERLLTRNVAGIPPLTPYLRGMLGPRISAQADIE